MLTLFIILIILLLAVIVCLVIANKLYDLALNVHTDKSLVLGAEHNSVDDWDKNEQDPEIRAYNEKLRDWKEHLQTTDAAVCSFDGLHLHAIEIDQAEATHNYAILCHGYMCSSRDMLGFAQQFQMRGFNLLLPDARGAGQSEGDYLGMGWHDSRDVLSWINYLIKKDAEAKIVLFGVSMGAATVMMAAGHNLPPNVRLIVEDCGYTSVWDEFAYQMQQLFHLPNFPLLHFASLVTKVRAGYGFRQASALKQLANSHTPILFIHGSEDTFVPSHMLDELYAAAPCPKDKLLVEGAGHGMASVVGTKIYWPYIEQFISQHL